MTFSKSFKAAQKWAATNYTLFDSIETILKRAQRTPISDKLAKVLRVPEDSLVMLNGDLISLVRNSDNEIIEVDIYPYFNRNAHFYIKH